MDLVPWTMQGALNAVWNWFVVEKNSASYITSGDGSFACQYRGPNGCRCAVGVLIPPSYDGSDLDGLALFHVRTLAWEVLGELPDSFLRSLQRSHDKSVNHYSVTHGEFHFQIEQRLRQLAAEYQLTLSS